MKQNAELHPLIPYDLLLFSAPLCAFEHHSTKILICYRNKRLRLVFYKDGDNRLTPELGILLFLHCLPFFKFGKKEQKAAKCLCKVSMIWFDPSQ